MLLVSNVAFGQKCLFFVHNVGLTVGDKVVSDRLKVWGYEVTPVLPTDYEFLWSDSLALFDFMVASESIVASELALFLRTIPLPFVNLEGWMVKIAWSIELPNNETPQPVKIADDTGHPLAVGFTKGDTVTIVYDKINGLIVGSRPTIDIIPIATFSTDKTKMVIYGIEAGTKNIGGETIQNRVATVGIHAYGYPYTTDAGWKFIKAGIDWVLGESSAVAEEQHMLTQFELAQNYPNPFNPTTNIHFQIPKAGQVTISVYNSLGQQVATLVDRNMKSGMHQVTFEAANLSSGIYFYRIKADGFSQMKKMMLMK